MPRVREAGCSNPGRSKTFVVQKDENITVECSAGVNTINLIKMLALSFRFPFVFVEREKANFNYIGILGVGDNPYNF